MMFSKFQNFTVNFKVFLANKRGVPCAPPWISVWGMRQCKKYNVCGDMRRIEAPTQHIHFQSCTVNNATYMCALWYIHVHFMRLPVINGQVWWPDLVYRDAHLFYTKVITAIPFERDISPHLKRHEWVTSNTGFPSEFVGSCSSIFRPEMVNRATHLASFVASSILYIHSALHSRSPTGAVTGAV
jgi:hypothetical protein